MDTGSCELSISEVLVCPAVPASWSHGVQVPLRITTVRCRNLELPDIALGLPLQPKASANIPTDPEWKHSYFKWDSSSRQEHGREASANRGTAHWDHQQHTVTSPKKAA